MASTDLNDAFRLFTTTVGFITTNGRRGPNVMAAEWTFNVSYDPFLISVHVAPGEATHEAIVETGEFGVNLVAEHQRVAMAFAGHFSQHEVDKVSICVRDLPREANSRADVLRVSPERGVQARADDPDGRPHRVRRPSR